MISIELNQKAFRRLVHLYLLSFVASIVALVSEAIIWIDFTEAFDRLTTEHFGEPSELQLYTLGGLLSIGAIAHIAAAIGLLKFKRWSRSLIWMSLLLMVPIAFAPGFSFSWSGPWSIWIESIGSALLGAIILFAYSGDHGAIWFGDPQISEDRTK